MRSVGEKILTLLWLLVPLLVLSALLLVAVWVR
jgi:hypothetical protein